MQRKNLTGWLILLIIILSVGSLGQGMPILSSVSESYQPYFAAYPSLRTAVMLCLLLFSASIGIAVYTAWVLYRRKPGTLWIAQYGLLLTTALRLASAGSIPVLGGLPADIADGMKQRWLVHSAMGLGLTAAWYLYLVRSKKVQEIYASNGL